MLNRVDCWETTSDFERSDWLSAARAIRAAVKGKSKRDSAQGFQKWLGLRSRMQSLEASKSLHNVHPYITSLCFTVFLIQQTRAVCVVSVLSSNDQ